MVQQFKVVEVIYDRKIHKKSSIVKEFENKVNDYLAKGWSLLNCIYSGSFSEFARPHYTAFLIKEI